MITKHLQTEGATPMSKILRDLALHRDHIILSLELFNPEYYKLDAATVINTGLAKLKATVTNAMG